MWDVIRFLVLGAILGFAIVFAFSGAEASNTFDGRISSCAEFFHISDEHSTALRLHIDEVHIGLAEAVSAGFLLPSDLEEDLIACVIDDFNVDKFITRVLIECDLKPDADEDEVQILMGGIATDLFNFCLGGLDE